MQTHFKIEWLGEEVDSRNITVEVLGPELQRVDCRLSFDSAGGNGTFTPTHVGMHQVGLNAVTKLYLINLFFSFNYTCLVFYNYVP